MAEKIDIFNNALTALGEDRLINPGDTSDRAQLLEAVFPLMRDATLRAHPWNFALYRTTLAPASTAPAYGYAKAYELPTDPWCLRVYELADKHIKYDVEGRKLLTDAGAPLHARLIVRVEEIGLYDPLCVDACALRLAWRVCYRLTENRALQQDIWTNYVSLLREARSVDAQEGFPEEIEASELEASRY